jgi:3-deoxy-D-manno-octulosonic-acid transferase
MILTLETRGCPMVLLNARASRTCDRLAAVSARLLAPMRLITVQDAALIGGLVGLGVDPGRIASAGNLKADIDPPQVDDAARAALVQAATERGLWAAVSTLAGEEPIVLDVQAKCSGQACLGGQPLLILVPRHPDRGDGLAADLARRGLRFTRHSLAQVPDATTQVHLVDALGVTGTVCAAAGLAFVGGSLVPGHGGHTPYEPIALGCAVLSGPHLRNFASAYAALQAMRASEIVPDASALAARVGFLLADEPARHAMQAAALTAYGAQRGATARTLDARSQALPGVVQPQA